MRPFINTFGPRLHLNPISINMSMSKPPIPIMAYFSTWASSPKKASTTGEVRDEVAAEMEGHEALQTSDTCAVDEDNEGDGDGIGGVGGEGSDLLVVHFDDGVVHVVIGVGTAHDTDDREVLVVSTDDGIEDTKLADCEGEDASIDATGPRVAVGGVSCVKLIVAANVFKPKAQRSNGREE